MINPVVEFGPPLIFLDPPEATISHSGTKTLFIATAESFGVKLTAQERYDWQATLGASMLIDHLIDVEKSDINEPFQKIMAGNIRPDLNQDIQIRSINYLGRQTAETRARIFDLVPMVGKLAIEQRNATKAKEVINIRKTEAPILASILSVSAAGEDSAARIKFNDWIQSWSTVGYLTDSLIDMRADYANGESSVKPTPAAAVTYAHAAASEGFKALKNMSPKLIAMAANHAFKSLILNRKPAIKS